MKPLKELEIVVGLCERDGRLLLIQRKDTNQQWDHAWEFPGGKLEEGESAEDAIAREIKEETGLTVSSSTFFGMHHHDWDLPDKTLRVHIHCFHCVVGDGDVVIEVDKAYQHAWPTITEALSYDSLSANQDILKRFIACTDIEHGLK
ncbi:NUDIX domain-containing protein [Candidatus Uhrbacteria bacterium]|jgi:8-oxo-dGTP diphosphatase|nr:NUDIX domain-containing protein [Candidatus Uhrbacteria bacterium]